MHGHWDIEWGHRSCREPVLCPRVLPEPQTAARQRAWISRAPMPLDRVLDGALSPPFQQTGERQNRPIRDDRQSAMIELVPDLEVLAQTSLVIDLPFMAPGNWKISLTNPDTAYPMKKIGSASDIIIPMRPKKVTLLAGLRTEPHRDWEPGKFHPLLVMVDGVRAKTNPAVCFRNVLCGRPGRPSPHPSQREREPKESPPSQDGRVFKTCMVHSVANPCNRVLGKHQAHGAGE